MGGESRVFGLRIGGRVFEQCAEEFDEVAGGKEVVEAVAGTNYEAETVGVAGEVETLNEVFLDVVVVEADLAAKNRNHQG